MKQVVMGIVAHVDSGKTTLSEALLYHTGELRTLGRVDRGDAFLDTGALERSRGITITAKQAVMHYGDAVITLLDTPGHVDFSSETERALAALDCAILLVSGTDGIQSHTLTLWSLLQRRKIPTILFVNKMDGAGADKTSLMPELRARLGDCCVDFSADNDSRLEDIAMLDESLMNSYLETGELSDQAIQEAVQARILVPCFFGSALRVEGIDALLDSIVRFAPTLDKSSCDFGGLVYKVSADEQGVRLTHIKVNKGILRVRDVMETVTADGQVIKEKITALRLYSGARFTAIEEATPGMTVAALGLTAPRPGQGLGITSDAPAPSIEPVLTCTVLLPDGVDRHEAYNKLRILGEEDPLLRLGLDEGGNICVDVMGEVQLEILKADALSRFGLDLSFSEGRIAYRETVTRPVEGVGHFEPLRHYAEVHLLLEPLPLGSGLQFRSICREEVLQRNWQNLVLTHLAEKTHRGVLTGSPITDMRISLVSGRSHLKHTEGGDFREATYRAVRQGLRTAGTTLLEPLYRFSLSVPHDCVGRAMSDLQRMDAVFDPPIPDKELTRLEGSAPVASMAGYASDVARYTRGLGRLACSFGGYAPCRNPDEVIASAGYDCDSDVANTADSVFCSHGAGFTVRWDDVYRYMHLEGLGLEKDSPAPEEEPAAVAPSPSPPPVSSLMEDKELLKIFERTYGPVKRDIRAALRSTQDPVLAAAVPKNRAEEYLLVDGYNIIFAWDDLRAIAVEDLDAARSALITRLSNYQGYCKNEVIVVFDAYRVKGAVGEVERHHNISVVYTKEAETADMYIEKAARRLAKHRRVRVATSDTLEQLIIIGAGARRISAESFQHEMQLVERAIDDVLEIL